MPKGFRPLYTLRVRDIHGFDYFEPSPQFSDISQLRKYESTHVRLRGLQYTSADGKLGAFLLTPIGTLETENVKLVNYGDGSFMVYSTNATLDGEVVQRIKDMQHTIIEPLSVRSWNTREEYLHHFSSMDPKFIGKQ